MFQTLVSGLGALTGLNAVGAANRKFYDNLTHKDLINYNGSCLHILLASSLVLITISGVMYVPLSRWLHIPGSWIFWAILISSGNFIIQFRLGQWQIREKPWEFGFMQVSQSIVLFVFTLVFLLLLKQGAASRVNSLITVTSLFVSISLITLYKEDLLRLTSYRKDFIRDALKFGVPLVPHIIGIFFLSAIDRILINDQLGVGEAGIYMLAVQLSLGMVVVFDAINKALIPWLFRILSEDNLFQLRRLIKFTYLYFIVLIVLGCLAFWIGPIIVTLVAGEQYKRAVSVIGWLCLGQAFNGMYLMVTNYLFYAKRTGRLSVITISCGVFNIALLLYLMQINGIVGVAIAFSVSMLLRFIATWILVLKLNIVSWNVFSKNKVTR